MLAHKPIGMSAEEFACNRAASMERRREITRDWAALIVQGAMPDRGEAEVDVSLIKLDDRGARL